MVSNSEKDKNGLYTTIYIDPMKTHLKVGQKLKIEGIVYTIRNIKPQTNENGKIKQEIELSTESGYLICQKCRGYYKLQPGENSTDFIDKCECGGNLRYAISIDIVGENRTFQSKQKYDESNKKQQNAKTTKNQRKEHNKSHKSGKKLINCPDCGYQISKKADKCPNCGRKLNNDTRDLILLIGAFILGILLFGSAFIGMTIGIVILIIVIFPIVYLVVKYQESKKN